MAKSGQGLAVLLGLGAAGAIAYAVLSKPAAGAQSGAGLLPQGTGGAPPWTCELDSNIPPALAQQINAALSATGVPADTYTQLAQLATANGFPKAASCLSQAAMQASLNSANNPASQSTNNSIGQTLGKQPFSPILQHFVSSGILSSLGKQATPPAASPVDWSNLNTSFLNQIAALKTLGYSSADALAIANYMQQGMTQAQAILAWQQANQPAPAAPPPGLSTWQQKASSSISQAGVDPVTAQQIASQLSDAQSRYIDWLIRLGNYSYDDARPPTISGASELASGWQIESGMSPTQKKALGWLFQDAWSPTTGTPSISASWPPTPAVVRRLAQLASAMSDTTALTFLSKIQTGTGIRRAYEQAISAGGQIQVQPDGSVTSTA